MKFYRLVPINVGNTPLGISYDPVFQRMYIANSQPGTVSILDTQTNTMITGSPISIGNGPERIAYDPANRARYVANFDDGTVSGSWNHSNLNKFTSSLLQISNL